MLKVIFIYFVNIDKSRRLSLQASHSCANPNIRTRYQRIFKPYFALPLDEIFRNLDFSILPMTE